MKKPIFIYITFLLAIPFITSCVVVSLTKGKEYPEHCDHHHKLTGKTAIVGTRYGKLYEDGYAFPFAKKPHAMGCLIPLWPKHRLTKIYVCKQCTRDYHHSKRENRKNRRIYKRKNKGFIPMPEF